RWAASSRNDGWLQPELAIEGELTGDRRDRQFLLAIRRRGKLDALLHHSDRGKTCVSGSANVPGWESWKMLGSVTAYHSLSEKWRLRRRIAPRWPPYPLHAVTFARSSEWPPSCHVRSCLETE